jgi:hypothetical protein
MNHFSYPKTSKSNNMEINLLIIQCYKIWNIFSKKNSNTCDWTNEGRETPLMGLEKYFKTLENMIDINAQTKWLVIEKFTHFELNLDMFLNMARMLKKKKKWRQRFGFQDFPIFKKYDLYSIVKDVGFQKTNIMIVQWMIMASSVLKELRKRGGAINGYESKLNLLKHSN